MIALIVVLTIVFAPLYAAHVRHVRRAAHRAALAASPARTPPPPCAHRDAVPVDLLLTGERVAWWCEACETQLEAGFAPEPTVPGWAWVGGGGGSSAFTGAGITIRYNGSPADGRQAGPAALSDS